MNGCEMMCIATWPFARCSHFEAITAIDFLQIAIRGTVKPDGKAVKPDGKAVKPDGKDERRKLPRPGSKPSSGGSVAQGDFELQSLHTRRSAGPESSGHESESFRPGEAPAQILTLFPFCFQSLFPGVEFSGTSWEQTPERSREISPLLRNNLDL